MLNFFVVDDYSDYIIDDNAENTKDSIDTEQEQWKENMVPFSVLF